MEKIVSSRFEERDGSGTYAANVVLLFDPPKELEVMLTFRTFFNKNYLGSRRFIDYFVKNGAYFLVADDEYVYFLNGTKDVYLALSFWHNCSPRIKCHVKYIEPICYCEHCNRAVEEKEIDIQFAKGNI